MGKNYKLGDFDPVSSPAIFPPASQAEDIWITVFSALTLPREQEDEFEQVVRLYRRLILGDVIRREWDSKFKLKGFSHKSKAVIKLHGEVTHSLLQLISRVFLRDPCDYSHPALWFGSVMFEAEAWGPEVITGPETTASEYMEQYRRASQMLWTLEGNPFNRESTKLLFDRAVEMAVRYDNFAPQVRKYADARRKLTSYQTKHKTKVAFRNGLGSLTLRRQGSGSKTPSSKK